MANIIPAILSADINEVQEKLNQLADLTEWAQIDLMDGLFVNNVSVQPEELSQLYTDINLEAHLMVQDPKVWLPHLNEEIFQRVYFHIEAMPEADELITEIKGMGFEAGLALNLETPLEQIEPFADSIDSALFMAIKPGWQGLEFKPAVLERIREFAHQYPDPDIAVDGGINESNILSVFEAGATNICVGSAIFAQGNIRTNIQKLKDKLT